MSLPESATFDRLPTGRPVARYELAARAWEWLYLSWVALIPAMIRFNFRFAHRYTLPLADFVFVAALAAFAATLLCRARQWQPSGWYRPLLAYSAALTLSTLASENARQSVPKLAGDLYLIAAAVMTVNYATNLQALRRIVFAWIAGAVMNMSGAAAGVVLFYRGVTTARTNPFLFQFGSLPPGHYPRIRGLFLDANMMCSYMVAAAMIIVAAYQAGWITRRVLQLLLACAVTTAAFSLSPGLGGLFLVLALWCASAPAAKPSSRLFVALGLLAALAFFAGAMISPTPLARTSLAETILHPEPAGRLLTWAGAWSTFLRHPWLGQGLGTQASATVHYLTANGILHDLSDAHNTWLSIMAQQGLVGIFAFSWVVVYLVRRIRLATPTDRISAFRTSVELAFIGGFLYQTLTGSFENTRHVWALMGLVAGTQQITALSSETKAG